MAETATLICPKCHGEMRSYERNGVVIDQCEECRGIFLDRGELDRLLDAQLASARSEHDRGREHSDDHRHERHDDGHDRHDDRHDWDEDRYEERHGKRRSRTSSLLDLLGGGE